MITISLCMIVKNEEAVIGRCLESVSKIVDEINIVDTGSTDRTKEIVAEYTERIFDFKWIEDFAAARNFAFQQATTDYILWLDADDIFLEQDQKAFLKLKNTLDSNIDAVSMNYNLAFDRENNVTSSLRRYRLVKRKKDFKWIGAVHEYLEVYGNLYESDVAVSHMPLSHDAERNLRIYENLASLGKEFSPRDLFYYANELVDHGKIEKAIEYYLRFLKTKQGWVEDNIRACNKLADCYNHLGLKEQELSWVLCTLAYGPPRPETCCRLAFSFLQKDEISTAIYWYKKALENKEEKSLSFQNHSCATWLPHLQLAVCYDKIGQHQLAFQHNEEALKYRPQDSRMLSNKKYFEKILNS
ncbi:tetratricopeptide repeat-containing glycosyltransferase family 2 protein [Priestia megaterium]|uniref:tetratricopeptide repeat-containing glycosyltransferase family 2 protein n=1 Tax=Priestia megaterium TaxID=1404 RepID=UPI000BF9732A|nr:glycosyltransferase [Priestia megaterium]PFI91802.1 glycosyl transferase [Priestia megaterium]PGR14201.1 glycosyl transferase [Priestia megaterium]